MARQELGTSAITIIAFASLVLISDEQKAGIATAYGPSRIARAIWSR